LETDLLAPGKVRGKVRPVIDEGSTEVGSAFGSLAPLVGFFSRVGKGEL
jgi:hypothetical protein